VYIASLKQVSHFRLQIPCVFLAILTDVYGQQHGFGLFKDMEGLLDYKPWNGMIIRA